MDFAFGCDFELYYSDVGIFFVIDVERSILEAVILEACTVHGSSVGEFNEIANLVVFQQMKYYSLKLKILMRWQIIQMMRCYYFEMPFFWNLQKFCLRPLPKRRRQDKKKTNKITKY